MKATVIKGVLMLGLAGCLGVALPAAAQLSNYFRVFDQTQTLQFEVSVTEAALNPNTIYFIPLSDLVDVAQFGQATNVWDDFVGGMFSDIFGIASVAGCAGTNGDLCLAFMSGDPPNTSPVGTVNVLEANMPAAGFDATRYLDPELQRIGWTALFWTSPDDGPSGVPEPGSLALLGIGAVALGAFRRRTHPQA